MTWLDKVKERWKRDELEGTWSNDVLFERFVQAREDRAKLLRLVEAYQRSRAADASVEIAQQHFGTYYNTTGLHNRLIEKDAAHDALTALLESDDA